MSFSISSFDVTFDDSTMYVVLSDGRSIDVPLWHFPRLYDATPEQRSKFAKSDLGIHWEEIDEDISIVGLFQGKMDNTRAGRARRAEIEQIIHAAE